MTNIPVRSVGTLWHWGTMNQADRHSRFSFSYEGGLLSASPYPEAWRAIAKLGGSKLWELTMDRGGVLLDAHSLKDKEDFKDARLVYEAWLERNAFTETVNQFEISYFDEDLGENISERFDTYEMATEEAEAMGLGVDAIRQSQVTAVTEAGLLELQNRGIRTGGHTSAHTALDMLLEIWVRDELLPSRPDIVGIYWNDILDIDRYSAPRAGLFPEALDLWHKTEICESLCPTDENSPRIGQVFSSSANELPAIMTMDEEEFLCVTDEDDCPEDHVDDFHVPKFDKYPEISGKIINDVDLQTSDAKLYRIKDNSDEVETYAVMRTSTGQGLFRIENDLSEILEVVGFYDGPTVCLRNDVQGKGLGKALIQAMATECGDMPPTAYLDEQLWSSAGLAAHRSALDAIRKLGSGRHYKKVSVAENKVQQFN